LETPTSDIDYVARTIAPVIKDLRHALESIFRLGYGSVTLRVEHGRVKQVVFRGTSAPNGGQVVDNHEK